MLSERLPAVPADNMTLEDLAEAFGRASQF
jgi:hypothetical protein